MPRRSRLSAVLLSVLLVSGWNRAASGQEAAATSAPLTVQELVERHVTAMGGSEALDSLRNIDIRFQIAEPSFTVEGRYRATRDGRMRVDIFAGDRIVFTEGIDSRGPWQRKGPGAPVEPVSEAGAAALRHGIEYNVFGLHRFSDRGHELELKGREAVEGTDYYVLKATLRDGFETHLYIDPVSWLVTRRRDVRALHPDLDPEENRLETVYQDFEEFCGVARATRSFQVDLATGDTVQTSRTLEQACNRGEGALQIPRDTTPGSGSEVRHDRGGGPGLSEPASGGPSPSAPISSGPPKSG